MLVAAVTAARVELGTELFELVQDRVRSTLGVENGSPGDGPVAAFVDQFAVYVPGITPQLRAAAAAGLDVDLRLLVDGCYAVDQATRVEIVVDRLLAPEQAPADDGDDDGHSGEPLSLAEAAREHHAAAMRCSALDPLTTELVRLRCAHHHACGH
jgi:hypothetical protein